MCHWWILSLGSLSKLLLLFYTFSHCDYRAWIRGITISQLSIGVRSFCWLLLDHSLCLILFLVSSVGMYHFLLLYTFFLFLPFSFLLPSFFLPSFFLLLFFFLSSSCFLSFFFLPSSFLLPSYFLSSTFLLSFLSSFSVLCHVILLFFHSIFLSLLLSFFLLLFLPFFLSFLPSLNAFSPFKLKHPMCLSIHSILSYFFFFILIVRFFAHIPCVFLSNVFTFVNIYLIQRVCKRKGTSWEPKEFLKIT